MVVIFLIVKIKPRRRHMWPPQSEQGKYIEERWRVDATVVWTQLPGQKSSSPVFFAWSQWLLFVSGGATVPDQDELQERKNSVDAIVSHSAVTILKSTVFLNLRVDRDPPDPPLVQFMRALEFPEQVHQDDLPAAVEDGE
jgi:hypothetical protein